MLSNVLPRTSIYGHTVQISIKKMFNPIKNVLNAVKSKLMPVAQISLLFQTHSLKGNILSENKKMDK